MCIMVISATVPAFGSGLQYRLERPQIYSISHDKNMVSITLQFSNIDHAEKYKIYRSAGGKYDFKYVESTSYTTYTDYDVKKGVRYYYKVRAVDTDHIYKQSKRSYWRSNKIPKPKAQVSATVYITETGSKYHRWGCQYLWNSCYSISKKNAIAYGYTACSRCW